jgi:hypothetical protein
MKKPKLSGKRCSLLPDISVIRGFFMDLNCGEYSLGELAEKSGPIIRPRVGRAQFKLHPKPHFHRMRLYCLLSGVVIPPHGWAPIAG